VADHWVGGRNCYLAEWGEYEPCGGHTYERILLTSVRPRFHFSSWFDGLQVKATLSVAESRRWFSVRVSPGWGYDIGEVGFGGKCDSIASAKRRADTWIYEADALALCLRRFYSGEHAQNVAQLDGTPFCSLMCGDYYLLPYGEWVITKPGERQFVCKRYGSGYSTAPLKAVANG
jgi:hypothetical protein